MSENPYNKPNDLAETNQEANNHPPLLKTNQEVRSFIDACIDIIEMEKGKSIRQIIQDQSIDKPKD